MKKLIVLFTFALSLVAQSDSPNYTQSNSAPNTAYTLIFGYDGADITYSCSALSAQPVTSTITVSSISNANPGVVTASSHGFYYAATASQKILVLISGATGGWSTLNGYKIFVPASSGSFTVLATDGTNFNTSGFGAWGAQAITVTTRAPKTTAAIWSVRSFQSESGNVTIIDNAVKAPANNSSGLGGGTTAYNFPCSIPTIHQ